MSSEFPTPQATVSGINFANIQRAIDQALLIRQQFLHNLGKKLWQSLDPVFLAVAETNELQNQQIFNSVTIGENNSGFTPIFPDEGIQEFKKIILEDYGIKLTDQQAYEDATAFLGAFKILADATLIQKDSIDSQRKGHGNVFKSAC